MTAATPPPVDGAGRRDTAIARPGRPHRATATWFAVSGVAALVRTGLEYADPVAPDPATLVDVAAIATRGLAGLAAGIALVLLWRDPPLRQGRTWLLLGGIGAIAQALATIAEDGLGVEGAVAVYVGAGTLMMLSLAAAGLGTLITHSPLRSSGVFYVVAGVSGGLLGIGAVVTGITWIAFAAWILARTRDLPPRTDPRRAGLDHWPS